jgi:hypothetical protein
VIFNFPVNSSTNFEETVFEEAVEEVDPEAEETDPRKV